MPFQSKVTELIQTVKAGKHDRVASLLSQGVDPNERMPEEDQQSLTGATCALMGASRQKDVKMLGLLVDHGMVIEGPHPLRGALAENCALHVSKDEQRRRTVATVKYLVEQGADINGEDPPWGTPFLLAIGDRDVEIVDYFIQHGADVNKITKQMTPLSTAIEAHSGEIVRLLLAHGAHKTDDTLEHAQSIRKALLAGKQKIALQTTHNQRIRSLLSTEA